MDIYLLFVFAAWNICTFFLMGLDKRKAINNRQRISEKTLLTSAFFMGGIGSLAGSHIFRHKTKKLKFQVLLPLAAIFNLTILWLIFNKVI